MNMYINIKIKYTKTAVIYDVKYLTKNLDVLNVKLLVYIICKLKLNSIKKIKTKNTKKIEPKIFIELYNPVL